MALLYGLGRPDFLTSGLTAEKLLAVPPMEFEITGESETKESKKFFDGELVTAGSARAATTFTMKVGIEAINWLALQLAYGELSGTTASVALPEIRYAKVPALTPFEIVDPDITTTNVYATVESTGVWGVARPLTVAATAPAAGEFQITTAGTKLVFNSAQAGAPIAYRVMKTRTNLESIGAETVFTALSSFSFSGLLYTDEELVKITIAKMSATGIPTLSVTDVAKFELEFGLVADGRRPFKLYRMPSTYTAGG